MVTIICLITCLQQVMQEEAHGNAPNIDKDGISRPQGGGFDIGCYEYLSSYIR